MTVATRAAEESAGKAAPGRIDSGQESRVRVAGIVLKWLRTDKEANYARAEKMIAAAAHGGARLVCTTECFLDGYAIKDKSIPLDQYRALGEPIPAGRYFQRLSKLADRFDIYLVAGMLEADGEHRYNTAVVLDPDGKLLGRYRKHKLEHELVRNTPGTETPVFRTPFGQIGIMICADRRDPQLVKRLCDGGADFLICPSGGMFGPEKNDPIVQARSKENGVPILFVHPAEFLVTDSRGEIRARTILGDRLEITTSEVGGESDKNEVFFFDLPLAADSKFSEDGKRYVIIHADDADMSHSVNRATIAAMEQGIVSSASIMVPCPWFKEFAAYAKAHPDKDFGIHLTLNSEWDNYRWGPVAGKDKVPSLVDKEGYLWDNVAEVAANAKSADVETELRAQIRRALDFGVPLTHLDTHMGAVVSRPDLVEVYVNLGVEFNLPVFFLRNLGGGVPDEQIRARALQLVDTLNRHKLPVLDYMTQLYTNGRFEDKRAQYLEAIANSKPGVHYLILHCGYDDEELQAITASSKLRDTDRRVFTDPEFIRAVKETGVEIVTWKQVREMNDKRLAEK
ncbi:MAG: ChbG/HpnK family deacetylase [Planctomycetes bacterium]|nr:ChbG/HpnK family deacetylase [Planctomycetota bacterium]